MIKTGMAVSTDNYKVRQCLGFRYDDDTNEKVNCTAQVKGKRFCSGNAAGHGHMQISTRIAENVKLDYDWEI